MKTIDQFFLTFGLAVIFIIVGAIFIFGEFHQEEIQGEVIAKYVVDSGFRFIIAEDDGNNITIRVSESQYFGYEVGDWFDGKADRV